MPGSNLPKISRLGLSLAVIFVIAPSRGQAQVYTAASTSNSTLDLRQALGIRALAIDSSGANSAEFADTSAYTRQQKSPLAAVLFSIIPGGGQIYNGSYWKAPIVWGIQGYFVSQWIANNKDYRSFQSAYSKSITPSNPDGDTTWKGLRDTYLSQRDSYAWYIAGTYLLSILDAYVDAELSGFDVSPNLGATSSGKTFAVAFRMKL